MPPETRKVPQSDWDRHQPTIKALYHGQKLPLWKQNGERCVIRVMREEHDFDATLSQYEAQLRRWDSQKNLKRHEWAFLLSQYDTLAARGCQVRIVSSGQHVLESRILRARRHLQSTGHAVNTMSAPSQAFVEYQDSKENWIRYSSANQAPESDQPPSQASATLVRGSLGNDGQAGPVSEIEDGLALLDWSREIGLIARREGVHLIPNLNLGRLDPHDLRGAPGVSADALAPAEAPRIGPTTHELRLSHPRRTIQPSRRYLAATTPFRPPYIPVDPANHIVMHPVAQQILGQLSFLAPNNIGASSLALSTRDLRSDIPRLVKAIAYSVSNRIVMPQGTQHGTVFSLLSQAESLQRGLQEFLQTLEPNLRMCLADNLFRLAVEADDPQATRMVLDLARSKFAYVINPNRIKCTIFGREGHFTPLEVAAAQQNTELIQMLLRVGADPNHTYWKGFNHAQGALEHALWANVRQPNKPPWVNVRQPNQPPWVNIELVRLLLGHQALVRPETLRLLMRYPLINREIVQAIIERIGVEHHIFYFPLTAPHDQVLWSCEDSIGLGIDDLMTDIVIVFPNSTGFSSIMAFFSKCDAAVCGLCAYRHKDNMLAMLKIAALRGNTELVEFMLPMVPSAPLQELLVLAIRSDEARLVDRLLQVGATVDGPAAAVITISGHTTDEDEELPFVDEMTPLAEAIRCQDDILISRLENLGALSCISVGKEKHFEAAATAAAYIGNLTYLRRICEHGSAMDDALFSSALTAAVASDHIEIASFILVHAGAGCRVSAALNRAIFNCNKPAFDLLIEFSCEMTGCMASIMTNAVLWGNVEVLDCLVQLGVNINPSGIEDSSFPLTIAAMIGDKAILRWLLHQGAAPGQARLYEPSPLAVVVLHGDAEMVDLLLTHHACVRDELALSFAMIYNRDAFETLLSRFGSDFPKGLPGFGGLILMRAMYDAKVYQINQLLEAGMDPNSPARKYFFLNRFGLMKKIWKRRGHSWECRMRNEAELLPRFQNMCPLGYAISADVNGSLNRINMVRMLLEAGADPNRRVGGSPRQTSLLLATRQEDLDITKLLVQWGADVNRRPYGMRYSPLQQACQQGSLEIAMFLLQKGANVQAAPSPAGGGTALQMASQSGNVKLAQLLIDNGANVQEPPAQASGRTAFEGAAEKGRITMLEFLWDQACPAGFPRAELERARSFAEEEGHRGCAEYIDLLLMVVGDGRTPRLSVG